MVTAACYEKAPIFAGDVALELLQKSLFDSALESNWKLQAWAIFPNHYHIIALLPESHDISVTIRRIHGRSAAAINRVANQPGRKVWQNFWDTYLTTSASYLARLHYVHRNAKRHGFAQDSSMYPFCSAHWFETQADEAFVRTVYGFKIDTMSVVDDF